MPSIVTWSVKRGRKMRCKNHSTRCENRDNKRTAHRNNRRRVKTAINTALYDEDFDVEHVVRSEMYTSWEIA